jgi:RHS repeat-associated protein
VTVFHYDGDANLTSKTDALGIVTNQTFDALDRPLTTTYPADTAENVAYTYDQTGTGFAFGIGRLTSVTDTAGSLTRQYEERGNLTNETRVNGKTTVATSYTYDAASRVASMTYPDGTLVTYNHDAAGYVSSVTAQVPGASSATTVATLSHLPFGPMSGMTYGNGVVETRTYDSDYRATNITDVLSGATGQNLTYVYDNANNVKSITDAVNPANSQTLGYDVIDRLTSAASAAADYGALTWTYDKVGNRLTQVQGKTTTTYGYTNDSNRLASITATTMASLHMPLSAKPSSGVGPILLVHVAPPMTPPPAPGQLPGASHRRSVLLASIVGWPMLLAGFTGLLSFRKRFRESRLLVALCVFALLTGSTTLITSCSTGTSGGSTQSVPTPTPTAATPTFSPVAGTYTTAQSVTLSDSTGGATIYYTTDGTTPTASSTRYASAITISSTETLEAIAIISGYTNSAVASAAYTINIPVTVTASITTNANGNITSIPPADSTASATFSYNNANRLASVTGTPVAATFVYDWAGQRYSKSNPGTPATIYSYMQGGTLIAENDNGTVTDYIYADGRPIAILQPGASITADQVNYVHADRLGTPQIVTNNNGSVVWSTTYQPFGMTGLVTASINQNLRFPGQNFDAETGFSYNLNRDYMPNLGRYLETDPIGITGGINTYQYATSNPHRYVDRSGLIFVADDIAEGYLLAELFDLAAAELTEYETAATAAEGATETTSVIGRQCPMVHPFANGGTHFTTAETLDLFSDSTTYGATGGNLFLIPTDQAEVLLNAGATPSQLEMMIGLDEGTLDGTLVRIDVTNPLARGLYLPSSGTNSFFTPGGFTTGNLYEGVISSPLKVDPYVSVSTVSVMR